MGQHRGDGVETHQDLVAQQVGGQRPASFVGDVGEWDARGVLELGTDQVLRRAVAVGAIVAFVRLGLDQRHQFADVLDGGVGVDHQHVGHHGDGGDGDQVFLEVIGQLAVHTGRDGVVHRSHQQGVAVRLGLGHVVGTDGGTRTRLALNDDGLAEGAREPFPQCTRQNVCGATRCERNHQADGFGGPGLRHGCAAGYGCGQCDALEHAAADGEVVLHVCLLIAQSAVVWPTLRVG